MGMTINEFEEYAKSHNILTMTKDFYENRLKADMLAMLYKLRSEIINMPKYFPYTDQTRWFIDGDDVEGYIDEKINSLKEKC